MTGLIHAASLNLEGFFCITKDFITYYLFVNFFGYVKKKLPSAVLISPLLIAASDLSPTGNVNNFKGFFFITVHCVVIFVSKVD